MSKLLTIGMATYDDYDGVYFTIQSLRLYHNILKNIDYEILIVDNSPNKSHSKHVQSLINWISNGKYISTTEKISTSVRNEIFANAKGKYTLCLDCHVLITHGGIDALLSYYMNHPECKNIIQGPLLYDDTKNYATQFDPVWRHHMYGVWGTNTKAFEKGEPFEIPMMGLGLFSCETKNWLGFNNSFKGFGGEEGYIHEKFRLNGGKAICVPQLQWMHRFGRPQGAKYSVTVEDRIWNYFIGWLELTKDPNNKMIKDIYEHFSDTVSNKSIVESIFKKAVAWYEQQLKN